jgi:SAM-dependent methyltransferase
MNRFLRGTARAIFETFPVPEPIVEIGSYQVEGQQDLCDLRGFFADKDYLGVDMREGPGVDLVASVEKLPLADHSVGCVIALSTFEHVQRFWLGFEELIRVLRPDGMLVISCPFHFHIHDYPSDYWRFTPAALELLLERFPRKLIGQQGPPRRPSNVWAIAFGPEYPEISEARIADYHRAMRSYAKEPLPWFRRLRYQIGRLICGRRAVETWLDRERWEVQSR